MRSGDSMDVSGPLDRRAQPPFESAMKNQSGARILRAAWSHPQPRLRFYDHPRRSECSRAAVTLTLILGRPEADEWAMTLRRASRRRRDRRGLEPVLCALLVLVAVGPVGVAVSHHHRRPATKPTASLAEVVERAG